MYSADWEPEPIRNIARKKVEERLIDPRDNPGQATAAKGYAATLSNL